MLDPRVESHVEPRGRGRSRSPHAIGLDLDEQRGSRDRRFSAGSVASADGNMWNTSTPRHDRDSAVSIRFGSRSPSSGRRSVSHAMHLSGGKVAAATSGSTGDKDSSVEIEVIEKSGRRLTKKQSALFGVAVVSAAEPPRAPAARKLFVVAR